MKTLGAAFPILAILFLGSEDCRAQSFAYEETLGGKAKRSVWTLESYAAPDRPEAAFTLTMRGEGDPDRFVLDARWATLSCRMDGPERSLSLERSGDRILIRGTNKGKTIEREARIDGSPWYQALEWGLGGFARSGLAEASFWLVDPGDLSTRKMKAKRLDTAQAKTGRVAPTSIAVRMSVQGVSEFFFKRDYLFRAADGIFLSYSGDSSGPGSPRMTIDLVPEGP